MRAIVLGAAAGGGFPQWNSNAPACRRARAGDPAAPPRTQASIAVSGDDHHWLLCNASPDLPAQLLRTKVLHPTEGLRSTPLTAVALTSGEVDAVAGLLTLRERQPFTLYATSRTLAVLDANPIFEALARDIVTRQALAPDAAVTLPGGLSLRLFPVPGKVPLYLEGTAAPTEGDTAGLAITQGAATLYFIPGCAAMTQTLAERLRGAAAVLFDATLWTDDEMIRAGLSPKTGRRMGHMSVAGPGGVLEAFAGLDVRRRILIHINNSNPVLLDDSPESAIARAAGWEVAFDGMEIHL
jgi:pyrroloquinoline quinone biosynthesis protein B